MTATTSSHEHCFCTVNTGGNTVYCRCACIQQVEGETMVKRMGKIIGWVDSNLFFVNKANSR